MADISLIFMKILIRDAITSKCASNIFIQYLVFLYLIYPDWLTDWQELYQDG